MSDKPDPDDYDIPPTYTYPTDPLGDGRRGVIENRSYKGSAITHLLWNVEEGDVLDVETWGKTTPDPRITITGREFDEKLGVSEAGQEYMLWPRYAPNRWDPPSPWLRTQPGNESAGEIFEIIVIERSEEGE